MELLIQKSGSLGMKISRTCKQPPFLILLSQCPANPGMISGHVSVKGIELRAEETGRLRLTTLTKWRDHVPRKCFPIVCLSKISGQVGNPLSSGCGTAKGKAKANSILEAPRDRACVSEIARVKTHYRRSALFLHWRALCLGVMNIASKEWAYLREGKRNQKLGELSISWEPARGRAFWLNCGTEFLSEFCFG